MIHNRKKYKKLLKNMRAKKNNKRKKRIYKNKFLLNRKI
jgi:hypothetical protein